MSDQDEDQVSGPAREPAPIDRNMKPSRRPLKPVLMSQDSYDKRPTGPSVGLHPGTIEGLQVNGESLWTDATKGYLKGAFDAFDTAHKAVEAIYTARRDVPMNRFASEDEYWVHLADLADRMKDRATKALDYAAKNLNTAVAQTRTALETPIKSAATRPMSAEIRAHVAKLTVTQRNVLMREASRDVLDAILGAEPFLSGMSKVEHETYLKMYHERFSPEIAFRMKAMSHALEMIETRGPLVFPEAEKALGQSWTFIEVVRKRDAKMKAALAG